MSGLSRLRYREHPPDPRLAPLVETFWTLRGDVQPDASPRRILPDGCMDILFDLSPLATGRLAERPLRFAVGTMTRAIRVRHGGPVDFVGARFRPGAARAFISPPAS